MTAPGRYAVIGAGPAGLAAAHELSVVSHLQPIVFEATTDVGGLSTTIDYKGNRIDIGGHRFFTKSSEVLRWWLDILPIQSGAQARAFLRPWPALATMIERARDPSASEEVMLVRPRKSTIMFEHVLLDYPLRLSPAFIAALGIKRLCSIGLSYAASRFARRKSIRSLEDFYIARFGRTLFETFFKSYTEKVWGLPCSELAADWGAQRIKGLSVGTVLLTALGLTSREKRETSLTEEFLYPKFGPGQLWETAARIVVSHGGLIERNCRVTKLFREGRAITSVAAINGNGKETIVPVKAVLSSMPLRDLVMAVDPAPPADIIAIAKALPYRDFVTIGVLLRNSGRRASAKTPLLNGLPDNWIYIQESSVRMGRIQLFKNWSPAMLGDPATDWLGLEYFCSEGDELSSLTDAEFIDLGIHELASLGVARREDVIDACAVRMPKAYPVYAGSYGKLSSIKDYLDGIENLYPMGRNGLHRYNNQDHSVLTGLAAARLAAAGSKDKSAIWSVNTDQAYQEQGN